MTRSLLSHLVMISVFIAAALGLYGVKYQVKAVHEEVVATQRALLGERKALQVASAEWAYLSRPDRLAELSDKYLATAPVGATQVNDVASLPYPQVQYASAEGPALRSAPVVTVSMRGGAAAAVHSAAYDEVE